VGRFDDRSAPRRWPFLAMKPPNLRSSGRHYSRTKCGPVVCGLLKNGNERRIDVSGAVNPRLANRKSDKPVICWWARQDSNLQPDRYERPALTIELQAPPGRRMTFGHDRSGKPVSMFSAIMSRSGGQRCGPRLQGDRRSGNADLLPTGRPVFAANCFRVCPAATPSGGRPDLRPVGRAPLACFV
jgi:hypothetical protein